MAERPPQTYANHARFVPLYHFVAFGILVLYLVWTVIELVRHPSVGAGFQVLLGVALLLLAWYARVFALTVQDRVIRLEERLRLAHLLPEDLRARAGELTPGQLIGLRFASDEEVPELVRWVLEEGIRDRQAIKKRIRQWRPDQLRV